MKKIVDIICNSMIQILIDTYERIIIWLLVVQYVFVNLIFTTYTQNIVLLKDLSAPLLSLIVFALWICGDLAKYGRWNLPRHGIVTATVGALLYWLIPTIAGTSTAYGTELWGRMFCYFVQVWALIRFMDSFEKMGLFLKALVITNVLIVGYGLTQIMRHDILVDLGLIPDWGAYVFVSTHGNPNFLAGYLVATFPTIIGYWFITKNPLLILTLPILALVNIYEVVESEARGAYLATAICIPLYFIILFLNRENLRFIKNELWLKLNKGLAIFAIIAILAGVVFKRDKLIAVPEKIYNQMYSIVDFESNYTNWVRLVFFQMALDGTLRYPVFGRGLGSFNWNMPETRAVWYHRWGVSHNTDHPHNEHLEWLHDGGILGLTAFWWVLVAYFWTGAKEIWRHRKGYHFPLILAAFLGPWMQWIQGTFDVETRWTGNGVTMWFTVGFVLAFMNLPVLLKESVEAKIEVKVQNPKEKKKIKVNLSEHFQPSQYLPYAAAVLSLIIIFYSIKAWDFWMADHHLRNNMGYTDAGGGTAEYAVKEAEEAQKLSYSTVSVYYKLAYSYLMANRLDDALEAYRTLQSFAPNYAQIHINLAYLNDQMGFRTASAWERDRASMIEHNTRNQRDAAAYWLQLGYPMRAIAHMHYCFTIERERLDSGYMFWYDRDNLLTELARIYAGVGKKDYAKFELKEALDFNSDNFNAALLMDELIGNDEAERNNLRERLEKNSPNNLALVVMNMKKAITEKNFGVGLDLAEQIANLLPLPQPGGQPVEAAQFLGNTILANLQTVFSANFRPEKCMELAGWIYACQGRYGEAETFLSQAYYVSKNPQIVEKLAQVKARL